MSLRQPNLSHVYGLHAVMAMVRQQPHHIKCLWVLATAHTPQVDALRQEALAQGIDCEEVNRSWLQKQLGDVVHQGVAALVQSFEYTAWPKFLESLSPVPSAGPKPLVVALDLVQDPHNLGSLIRSAAAFGVHGLLLPKDRACSMTPVVLKTAAGAAFYLPIVQVTNLRRALEQLRQQGLWVVGTAPDAPQSLCQVDLTEPTVLVVGSEGQGIRQGIARTCDIMASIPIVASIGSLNAAVAGAVGLYEAVRQRGFKSTM